MVLSLRSSTTTARDMPVLRSTSARILYLCPTSGLTSLALLRPMKVSSISTMPPPEPKLPGASLRMASP